LPKIVNNIDKVVAPLSKWLHWVGVTFIFVMMLLTTADVVMRYIFNRPITGSYELTQYLMVIIISFTLAYGAAGDGLVRVTILSERLSARTQSIMGIFTGLLGIGLFIFITWRSVNFVGLEHGQHIKSPIIGIPLYPFAGLVVFGLVCLVLVLIIEWLHNLIKVMKR
jgi:TRAP-type transport system small permease protein